MRLVTYHDADGELRAGIVIEGVVVDARIAAAGLGGGAVDWAASVVGILEQDAETHSELVAQAEARSATGTPIAEMRLAPPVPDPAKIICIGLNYRSHVEEAKEIDGAPNAASGVPILFAKFATSLVGHGGEIVAPAQTERMDWEAELAVVIGRRAKGVSRSEALDYVGGYTAFNDVSARDLQLETPQWTAGKAPDTFGPCGPVLVTADELGDPQGLRVQARLNGETMQDATTDLMIFSVDRLIEFISSLITLVPGDIIATGTPAGVGVGRTPPVFMQAGDIIEVEIQSIGVLRNTVVSASDAAPVLTVDHGAA